MTLYIRQPVIGPPFLNILIVFGIGRPWPHGPLWLRHCPVSNLTEMTIPNKGIRITWQSMAVDLSWQGHFRQKTGDIPPDNQSPFRSQRPGQFFGAGGKSGGAGHRPTRKSWSCRRATGETLGRGAERCSPQLMKWKNDLSLQLPPPYPITELLLFALGREVRTVIGNLPVGGKVIWWSDGAR